METTKKGAVSVIGGGDTATACKVYDTVDKAGASKSLRDASGGRKLFFFGGGGVFHLFGGGGGGWRLVAVLLLVGGAWGGAVCPKLSSICRWFDVVYPSIPISSSLR